MKFTIKKQGTSLYIEGIDDKPIKIPSQKYPIPGQLYYITRRNTEPFPESPKTDKIKEIFNSIKPGIGTCYTNIKNLGKELNKEGIKATPFVGWVIVGDLPFHHCFAMIDNHILDFSPSMDFFMSLGIGTLSLPEAREKLTDAMIDALKVPNSEKCTFGQLGDNVVYIAAPCTPEQGLNDFQKLMKAFPKHPSYQNTYSNGMTETQRLMYYKLNQLK